MTRAGIIFLCLIILNTAASVGYLIWWLIFKRDTDNRNQYVMHATIMLLCPIVGIMYFLFSFIKYRFIKIGNRDLSDVEFSKKRHIARVKADEARERNIVSIGEFLSLIKRRNALICLMCFWVRPMSHMPP